MDPIKCELCPWRGTMVGNIGFQLVEWTFHKLVRHQEEIIAGDKVVSDFKTRDIPPKRYFDRASMSWKWKGKRPDDLIHDIMYSGRINRDGKDE